MDAFTLLSNAAAAGTHGSTGDTGGARTFVCTILPSNRLEGGSVMLHGSLDGSTWFTNSYPVNVNGYVDAYVLTTFYPCRYLRAVIADDIVGGTVFVVADAVV